MEDAARLEAAIISFSVSAKIQKRHFVIPFALDPQSIKDSILNDGGHVFSISPRLPTFDNFCRVRMQKARSVTVSRWSVAVLTEPSYYLEGVTTKNKEDTIKLLIQTSASFADKDIESPHRTRAYISLPREFLFEYNPRSKEVVTEGEYIGTNTSVLHAPFTNWKVAIQGDPGGLDFSGFTGVRLELWCEFTLMSGVDDEEALAEEPTEEK